MTSSDGSNIFESFQEMRLPSKRERKKQLNPRFVEALMNFPVGWVNESQAVESTNYVAWEMQSSRLLSHLLSRDSTKR